MKIRRTRRFKKDYQKLSTDIQERTDKKLRLLLLDRRHPSLRVHRVRGVPGYLRIECDNELSRHL